MERAVFDLLQVYIKHNRTLPDCIVMFRDGLSEGQFRPVLDAEYKDIKKVCVRVCACTAICEYVCDCKGWDGFTGTMNSLTLYGYRCSQACICMGWRILGVHACLETDVCCLVTVVSLVRISVLMCFTLCPHCITGLQSFQEQGGCGVQP